MRKLFTPTRATFYVLALVVSLSFIACDNDDDDAPACELVAAATGEAFTITATASGGVAPFEYSVDGGATFVETNERTRSFDVTEARNYDVVIRDAEGCEQTATVSADQVSTFTDTRDSQTYRVIRIGDQIWLGENLNYETDDNSFCYDDNATNCTNDGRLYTWDAAQDAVPEGWKLPSEQDIDDLVEELSGGETGLAANQAANKAVQPGGSSSWEDQFAGYLVIEEYQFEGERSRYWRADGETDSGAGAYESRNESVSPNSGFGNTSAISQTVPLSVRLLKED
ncbi:MAG: FISUMP domain-containing protein [Bacteroidota bacterium]